MSRRSGASILSGKNLRGECAKGMAAHANTAKVGLTELGAALYFVQNELDVGNALMQLLRLYIQNSLRFAPGFATRIFN